MNENKFISKGIRLTRYLYSLGFNKESKIINGKEVWILFLYEKKIKRS